MVGVERTQNLGNLPKLKTDYTVITAELGFKSIPLAVLFCLKFVKLSFILA